MRRFEIHLIGHSLEEIDWMKYAIQRYNEEQSSRFYSDRSMNSKQDNANKFIYGPFEDTSKQQMQIE